VSIHHHVYKAVCHGAPSRSTPAKSAIQHNSPAHDNRGMVVYVEKRELPLLSPKNHKDRVTKIQYFAEVMDHKPKLAHTAVAVANAKNIELRKLWEEKVDHICTYNHLRQIVELHGDLQFWAVQICPRH